MGFEAFWNAYPRHVAKLAALKAYNHARKQTSAQEILDAVERYKMNKPAYADWCYPATWLNQGRWMDEPDRATAMNGRREADPRWLCPHVERCGNRQMCEYATLLGRPERQKARA